MFGVNDDELLAIPAAAATTRMRHWTGTRWRARTMLTIERYNDHHFESLIEHALHLCLVKQCDACI
jgi:hypothetical protein